MSVCVRERERENERGRGRDRERITPNRVLNLQLLGGATEFIYRLNYADREHGHMQTAPSIIAGPGLFRCKPVCQSRQKYFLQVQGLARQARGDFQKTYYKTFRTS